MKTFLTICAMIALPLQATAIVQNGGFETGDITGWTLTNSSVFDAVCQDGFGIGAATCATRSGTYAMSFGNGGGVTSFFQDLTTTAGQYYELSFWLANDNPNESPTQSFEVLWNGQSIFAIGPIEPTFPYQELRFSNLQATGSFTTLEFQAHHAPSQWLLDDVSVNESGVPEPATFGLAGAAIAGIALAARRRRV